MRRPVSVALIGLLSLQLAAPVLAQESLLSDVQVARQHYPTPMSPAQIGQLLNEVAWAHASSWRLLKKAQGNACPAPSGDSVSCDILVHMASGAGFDVLIDQEGAGTPNWMPKGTFLPEQFSMPVAPTGQPPTPPTGGGSPPIINVPPAQVVNLEPLQTHLDASIAAAVKALTDAQGQILADEVKWREEQNRQHAELMGAINNPGWFTTVFGNRFVQMGIAGVVAWLGTKAMTNSTPKVAVVAP